MKIKFLNYSNLLILIPVLAVWWMIAYKIEPFLIYYGQQIGFSTSLDFLKNNLASPGGISNYLADFVSQFFKFNIFGSILIVAIATIQGLLALNIVKRLVGKTKFDFSMFVVVLLLGVMVMCDYRYPYHASIRVFFVFLLSWGFSIVNNKYTKQSICLWPVMALLFFYLAGGAALIVYSISSALIIIYTRPKKIAIATAASFVIFAGIIPFIAYKLIFPSNLWNLYRVTEIKHPEMLTYTTYYHLYAYYLILPLILLAVFFLKIIPENKSSAKTSKGKKAVNPGFFKKTIIVVSVQLIAYTALGYFMFIKSFDPVKKKILYIEYYGENSKWQEILKVAESIKVYDFRVNYQVARAYANLGLLPDQLFNYPQLLGSKGIFFESSTMIGSLTMPASDLYFDLGFMSESLHWAFEAQTLLPNSPRILKRLVMIYLVNRKYNLAEKFLNVLDQNMLYKDWVEKYEGYVVDTTLAANDLVIAEKRRFSPQKKAINSEPLENLKLLLETNKDNRLALDYLMTLLILDINLPEFVNYVQNYRYYKIKTLPKSWAEALAVHILKIKSLPPFVDDDTISKDCMERFKAFNNLMMQFNNNKDAAMNTARKEFENTYWYYMLYLNPKVTNALNNKALVR